MIDGGSVPFTIGGSAVLGGVVGFAAKKVIKVVLVLVGVGVGGLAVLESEGLISVQWTGVQSHVDSLLDVGSVESVLSTGLAGGGFVAGAILGFKTA